MAITVTNEFLTVMGDKVVGLAKLTHDGTSTTVNLPSGTLEMAYALQTVGTSSAGVSVSWSGKTLTLSVAAASGQTDYVFFVGTA